MSSPVTTQPTRLVSLDVFRGMTIASMMLVNNPGSWSHVYPPLRHAEWHGWTFTDTIFPFFLWIVGVAIPFSLSKRMEQGEAAGQLFGKIVRRTLILIALGLFLNGFGHVYRALFFDEGVAHWMSDLWNTWRFPGVLQRIGICYFFTSIIVMSHSVRGQMIWTAAFLVVYAVLMSMGSMPGFPAGDLSKEGNFSHYIDSMILGNHNWRSAKTWDPEGIISTLPAISTCLFGVLTGHLLRMPKGPEEKASWIFTAGALLMFAGQLIHLWMPINKPIWTSSYAVFMAGLAMIVFGVCYWLVDIRGYQRWAKPFAIYGMNAIVVFVLAGIIGRLSLEITVTAQKTPLKTFLFSNLFGRFSDPKMTNPPLLSPEITSLMWASLVYVLGLYLVAYFLYRRKWFLKI